MKWIQLPLITMLVSWAFFFIKSPHVESSNTQSEWLVRFDEKERLADVHWPREIQVISVHEPLNAVVIQSRLAETELRNYLNAIPGIMRIEKGRYDGASNPVYPTGLAILEPTSFQSERFLADELHAEIVQSLDALHWWVVEIPRDLTFAEFEAICKKSGYFSNVFRDEIVQGVSHQTNDPMYASSWHIQQANDKDMDASEAWALLPSSATVRSIAIIEGVGFDTLNADLAGRFIDRFNAVDNSTNVYSNTTSERHGTATSGIPGAIANNAISAAGLGYNKLKIQAIRIGYNTTTAGSFTTTSVMQVAAINRAMTQSSTAAISMSIGLTTYQSSLATAITNARTQSRSNKGIPVFASAGNSSLSTWTNYPASYAGVIAVAATTSSDTRASFSNYGTGITLAAPGSSIATTDITGVNGYSTGDNTSFSGTSAACPVAATVGALMIVVYDQLTETQIKQYLAQSCEKVGGYSYANNSTYTYSTWSNELGYGRVNMQAAMQLALNASVVARDISLAATSVSSTTPQVGQTITINCTQQVSPATGSTLSPVVEYRYSNDASWSVDDVLIGTDVSTLGNGISSEAESITFTIPTGSGTKYILIRSDAQSTVTESNETNNTTALTISIPTTSNNLPDLTITNASSSAASATIGQVITINCTQTANAASAVISPLVQYRLSTDAVWSSSDVSIGSDISTLSSSTLNESENITYTIPNQAGTRYILIKADAGSSIAESNENNNVVAIPITIVAAMMADDSMNESKSAEENHISNIRIFPNPATDRIWIESNQFDWNNLQVFSADGQLKITSERTQLRTLDELHFPQLSGGVYVLQFSDGIKTIAHRIVIE